MISLPTWTSPRIYLKIISSNLALRKYISIMKNETGAIVCYDTNPERLLNKLEHVYKERIFPGT
jgi:hypothetical protein